MLYRDYGLVIPPAKRAIYNEKVLASVRSTTRHGAEIGPDAALPRETALSREDVFNAYTGKGGLHGLSRADFPNRYAYTAAKRSRDEGQFFTPPPIAAFIARCLGVGSDEAAHDEDVYGEAVCDPACGHGALLNAFARDVGDTARLYGCELDADACDVARYLFPEAHIERTSFVFYDPGVLVDVVAANPPFALDVAIPAGGSRRSEDALLLKAAEVLRPGGLAAVIVPAAHLTDAFQEKRRIRELLARFVPLAEVRLPEEAFAGVGVSGFETKVIFLQRRLSHDDQVGADEGTPEADPAESSGLARPGPTGAGVAGSKVTESKGTEVKFEIERVLCGLDEERLQAVADEVYREAILPARKESRAARAVLQTNRVRSQARGDADRSGFHDVVRKLLFDIGRSPAVRARLAEARGYYERFLHLEAAGYRPGHLSAEEYLASRITEADVIAKLASTLSAQHDDRLRRDAEARGETFYDPERPETAIRLVKTGDTLHSKTYTPEAEAALPAERDRGRWSVTELALLDGPLPLAVATSPLRRIVTAKRRLRLAHSDDLMAAEPDGAVEQLVRSAVIMKRTPPNDRCSPADRIVPGDSSSNGHDPSRGGLHSSGGSHAGSQPDAYPDAFRDLGPLFAAAALPRAATAQPGAPVAPQVAVEQSDHPKSEEALTGGAKERFYPTKLQAQDLSKVIPRRYAYLAWQQGCGKTLAGYLWSRAKLGCLGQDLDRGRENEPLGENELLGHARFGHARIAVVLAPALAAEETWVPFLEAQGVPFTLVRTRAEIESVDVGQPAVKHAVGAAEAQTLVVPSSMIDKLKRPLARLVKRARRQVALVVDEADELANYDSLRTQATLAAFRRCRYKLLMTGTVTRNHIGEVYPQLELLYNNSALMGCEAQTWWTETDDGELTERANDLFGKPFPARSGREAFNRTFCPRRPTVFGILRHDQDVYNAEAFTRMIARTRIVRTFDDIAGPGRYSLHHHGVPFSDAEAALHERVIKEFQALVSSYFTSTGNDRKDAGLRAVRQLRLLIESCSHPTLFPDYTGTPHETSTKTERVRQLVQSFPDELVAVGIRRREAFGIDLLERWAEEVVGGGPARPVFRVDGAMPFPERGRVLDAFEASGNGVLVATQQSLASSVNVPACNRVIIPALAWNMPSVQQHYFRFIRFDMRYHTEVHIVTYERSIEANLLALNLNKERLNLIVRDGEAPSTRSLIEELGFDAGLLDALMEKHRDVEGNVHIRWAQSVHAGGQSVSVGA